MVSHTGEESSLRSPSQREKVMVWILGEETWASMLATHENERSSAAYWAAYAAGEPNSRKRRLVECARVKLD